MHVTVRPIYKLLTANKKDRLTVAEITRACSVPGHENEKYEKIFTELRAQLEGFKEISKQELIQRVDGILTTHGYGLYSQKHPIMFKNTFWPCAKSDDAYDQAFYATTPVNKQAIGHVHEHGKNKSLFYFRCERHPTTQELLIGNIQPANWQNRPPGIQGRNTYKRIMIQAALNHARAQGAEKVIIQGGEALMAAQRWKTRPKKLTLRNRYMQPEAPVITEENYKAWHQHYETKIEQLQLLSPRHTIRIDRWRYHIKKQTATAITIQPEFYGDFVISSLFNYLCNCGSLALDLIALEKRYGPGIVEPYYFKTLTQLSELSALRSETIQEINILVKQAREKDLSRKIDNIFRSLGMSEAELRKNSTPKSNYMRSIKNVGREGRGLCPASP